MIFMMGTSIGVKSDDSGNKVGYVAAPVNRKLKRKAIISAMLALIATACIVWLLGTEAVSAYIRKEP